MHEKKKKKSTGVESTKVWFLKYSLLIINRPRKSSFRGLELYGLALSVRYSIIVLPAGAQWSRQHDRSGVDGLVEALLVHPSGEFSYQNRSHPLEAQLFMNAQELDLHHVLLPAQHIQPALRLLQENCYECWQCLPDVTWTHAPVSIYEELTLHIWRALQGPQRWSPPAYYWRRPWCRSATGLTSLEAVKPWGGKECH